VTNHIRDTEIFSETLAVSRPASRVPTVVEAISLLVAIAFTALAWGFVVSPERAQRIGFGSIGYLLGMLATSICYYWQRACNNKARRNHAGAFVTTNVGSFCWVIMVLGLVVGLTSSVAVATELSR